MTDSPEVRHDQGPIDPIIESQETNLQRQAQELAVWLSKEGFNSSDADEIYYSLNDYHPPQNKRLYNLFSQVAELMRKNEEPQK